VEREGGLEESRLVSFELPKSPRPQADVQEQRTPCEEGAVFPLVGDSAVLDGGM
jgi:hypothetical protein